MLCFGLRKGGGNDGDFVFEPGGEGCKDWREGDCLGVRKEGKFVFEPGKEGCKDWQGRGARYKRLGTYMFGDV